MFVYTHTKKQQHTRFYIFFSYPVVGLEYPLACASPTLETVALCLSDKFF